MATTDQLLLPGVESAQPLRARWESRARYYEATLQIDLLGDWVLTVARGGKHNRLGRLQHTMMVSREAGEREIEKLDRRRCSRGYLRMAD